MPDPLPYPDPPLGDGRIGLRPWLETDLECVRLAATDPVIPRGTTVPSPFSPSEALAFIHRQWQRREDHEGVSQAIVDLPTDTAVGLLWLALRPQPGVGGLGYWVVPSHRGRGAATAAVRLLVPWALATLRLHRLEAWVEPDNHASQRVLAACGFQHEGRLRNFLLVDAKPTDALVYAVIPQSG
ncbi:MAG: GNAT family N-acetyltransferase [Nocardioidaceae bacterium]|nr:GNAT family N-acetyltransferase [Nocardioidaceae bacterium]